MNTNYLISFLSLAETNSYQKTAEHLHYSRSTIMEHIHALEQELGVTLIQSQGRKLITTPAGERFKIHARKIVQTYQNALLEAMTFSNKQRLRIITIETIGLFFINTAIMKLIQTYPELDLSVQFVSPSKMQEMLLKNEADIAILFSNPPWDAVSSSGLKVEKICSDEAIFFANPNSWIAQKTDCSVRDLEMTKFILTKKDGIYSGHLMRLFKETGIHVVSMQYIDSGPLLKQFVINNDCVSMLSKRVIEEELRNHTLIEILPQEEKLMTDVIALYPYSTEENSMIKRFIRLISYHLNGTH